MALTPTHTRRIPYDVPELDLGTHGPELVFLHANAYPPECYRSLFAPFARDFRVRAVYMRPLWPASTPDSIQSWHALTDDFLAWIHRQPRTRIAVMGHSMGAIIALRAALQEPDRFGAVVLLDPVLYTPAAIFMWRLMRPLPLGHPLHSVIRRAQRRRTGFTSEDEAFNAYRRHAIFRRLGDDQLRLAIGGMLGPVRGHFELRYASAWEARLYYTAVWNDTDLWQALPALSVPTLIIRGAESDTFTEGACAAVRSANGRIQVETIEQATHLVPLERPNEVHAMAHRFFHRALRSATAVA